LAKLQGVKITACTNCKSATLATKMKNGVVIGLLISATGSALFRPAATLLSYPLFLGGLFIVGLGFAMLQIAANPYPAAISRSSGVRRDQDLPAV
jgi:fucose permease